VTETNRFLPASPDPSLTLPATRYVSAKTIPADFAAADEAKLEVQAAHWPLVWMLVLTQAAAGAFAVLPFMAPAAQPGLAGLALGAGSLGLFGSILHLGKPCRAWRAFLGLRKSWLSREIVALLIFGALAGISTAVLFAPGAFLVQGPLLATTAVAGLAAVLCSAMVYHVTRRQFWRGELVIGKFLGTAATLGLGLAWFATATGGAKISWIPLVLAILGVVRLAREFALLRQCADDAHLTGEVPASALGRSALILRFRLGGLLRVQVAAAWLGGVILPASGLLLSSANSLLIGCSFGLCLISEFADRTLFFRAAIPFRMPGGIAA
jgi:DMSO reductase anchor subunit